MGTGFVDRETNTSAVELRPQREETRIDIKHTYSKGVQVSTSHSEFSSYDTDIVRSSLARPCIPDIMPQLDGPTSIRTRRRPVQEFIQRTATTPRGGHHDESDSDSHDNRSHDEWRYSGRRGHYHDRGERPPDRRNDQGRGYSRNGRPPDDGGPPDDRGPPDNGGPPDDGGPPHDGGPLGNGRPPRQPGRQGLPGLLDLCILS